MNNMALIEISVILFLIGMVGFIIISVIPKKDKKINYTAPVTPKKIGVTNFEYKHIPKNEVFVREFKLVVTIEILREFDTTYEGKIIAINRVSPTKLKSDDWGEDVDDYIWSIKQVFRDKVEFFGKEKVELEISTPDVFISEDDLGKLLNNEEVRINNINIKVKDKNTLDEVFDIAIKHSK